MVILAALGLSVLDVISRSTFDIVFALAIATTPLAFLTKIGTNIGGAGIFTLALVGAILVVWTTVPDVQFTPYLAVALTNAAVAYMFLRGQLRGGIPLILQMIDLIDMAPIGAASFHRFIYWQCWAWVFFGMVTSFVALAATVAPDIRADAGVAITTLVMSQVAWFFLSHGYANWRYHRPETCWDTIRVMSRPSSWDALKI
ncbi:MAG: hypothetical protein HOG93_15210 [Rhodospirillaceae bacterium]|nr:hypothetical protein [Rhodospirillaceae bacterium]